jgi:hypothetical protein
MALPVIVAVNREVQGKSWISKLTAKTVDHEKCHLKALRLSLIWVQNITT